MATFTPGLVHAPVTPFKRNEQIDFGTYAKLIEFHLANGAQSLAVPMHAGESVSLTDDERMKLIEYALKRVNGRVPVIAHASQSGTGVAASLAQRAGKLGAAAVVATTPYYWTPPPGMLRASSWCWCATRRNACSLPASDGPQEEQQRTARQAQSPRPRRR